MFDESESLLEFPCRFPFKIMGRAGSGIEYLAVEIVRRHTPDLDESLVEVRSSSGGKWVSVTVVIEAVGRDQLDAIYRDLSADQRVVWAL